MRSTLRTLFDAEMTRTSAVLHALPPDDLGWAPDARSFTIGRLAMHVATLPGWMSAFTTSDGYDMGRGGPGPVQPKSRDEVLEAFAGAVDKGRAALDACPAETLDAPWVLRRDGLVVSTLTRATAIATFGLHHLVHHRGQLTVYLRLRGQSVPPLYGDSADARLLPRAPTPSASTSLAP